MGKKWILELEERRTLDATMIINGKDEGEEKEEEQVKSYEKEEKD